MNEHESSGQDRRAQHIAGLGFILQLAAYGTLLAIAIWSGSDAIATVSRFVLFGVPIWLVLHLIFKQVHRVRQETLETEALKRAQAAGSSNALFDLDDEALLIEHNRLQWMTKWILPATTVFVALLLIVGHFIAWNYSLGTAFEEEGLRRTEQPTLMMWFVVAVGFLCFLYARYVLAVSKLPGWELLHAGATCMAGNAVACLLLAIALMATTTFAWAEPLVAYVIRVAMLVIGIEFAVNFILDFYRPRGEELLPRPSFDGRLLGLLSEPGDIARSIADAVNYQFGFEVSSTWFYQLLQRWLFPIMVCTAIVVLALTSVVIVDANERAVVERFGRRVGDEGEVLLPGFHLKWPYPIDVVYRAPASRINELVIGEASEDDDEDLRKPIIWTEEHEYVPELMLLVASSKEDSSADTEASDTSGSPAPTAHLVGDATTESVPVSLLKVSVPIEYRIQDVNKFLYRYADPAKLLECVAYQFLSDLGASIDIDQLMGPGRTAFNDQLRKLLQQRLNELDAGIEIVFAGIRGAHPPSRKGVAEAFQSVISAQTNMGAVINGAEGEAQKILTAVAGTEERALALDDAIQRRDALASDRDATAAQRAEAEQRVEDLLVGAPKKGIAPLSGSAEALIAGARSRATNLITDASSKARIFATELAAFKAAPSLYVQRKQLEVFEDLDFVRKYLIIGDRSSVIVEYQTAQEGALDRVLSEGDEKQPRP